MFTDGLPTGYEYINSLQNEYADLPKKGEILPLIVTAVFSPAKFYVYLVSSKLIRKKELLFDIK